MHLGDKRALVCGASQGIGAATARVLADQGCRVIALARSEDKLKALVQGLPGEGHTWLAQDIADRGTLEKKVQSLLAQDAIHILINNSGGPPPGPVSEASAEAFEQGFANHVLVNSLLVRLLLPGMKSAGYGRIVNVISTSVKIPIPNLGVSNTIRGAVANWAKTLSVEVAQWGVTVNNVLPGFTKTPRLDALIRNAATKTGKSEEETAAAWSGSVPARRFAEAEEVAAAIGFLASPSAAYINGINLPVDGGRTGCL